MLSNFAQKRANFKRRRRLYEITSNVKNAAMAQIRAKYGMMHGRAIPKHGMIETRRRMPVIRHAY